MSVEVHHTITGPESAPPLVLSASLGATAAMWEPQVRVLCQQFRVIAYDTRGHGNSPVPDGPYEFEDLGGDVLALLDRLEIERAAFAGLSLGGMTGMWLAANAPERIDRLAVLCTSAYLPPPEFWADRANAVREAGTVEAIADAVVARWLTPPFAERHPSVLAGLRAMVAATPPEGYAACCGVIERMDLRDDLGRITAPTLVVGGADDPSTPPADHAQVIADRIPGARLEIVDQAAHLASVEQDEAVTALLVEHFTAS